jgi:hypothetical protein
MKIHCKQYQIDVITQPSLPNMRITEEITVYNTQGKDSSEGGVATQPEDPGKNSIHLAMAIADFPRLWQVILLENS